MQSCKPLEQSLYTSLASASTALQPYTPLPWLPNTCTHQPKHISSPVEHACSQKWLQINSLNWVTSHCIPPSPQGPPTSSPHRSPSTGGSDNWVPSFHSLHIRDTACLWSQSAYTVYCDWRHSYGEILHPGLKLNTALLLYFPNHMCMWLLCEDCMCYVTTCRWIWPCE